MEEYLVDEFTAAELSVVNTTFDVLCPTVGQPGMDQYEVTLDDEVVCVVGIRLSFGPDNIPRAGIMDVVSVLSVRRGMGFPSGIAERGGTRGARSVEVARRGSTAFLSCIIPPSSETRDSSLAHSSFHFDSNATHLPLIPSGIFDGGE